MTSFKLFNNINTQRDDFIQIVQQQTLLFPTHVKINKDSSFLSTQEDYQNLFYT